MWETIISFITVCLIIPGYLCYLIGQPFVIKGVDGKEGPNIVPSAFISLWTCGWFCWLFNAQTGLFVFTALTVIIIIICLFIYASQISKKRATSIQLEQYEMNTLKHDDITVDYGAYLIREKRQEYKLSSFYCLTNTGLYVEKGEEIFSLTLEHPTTIDLEFNEYITSPKSGYIEIHTNDSGTNLFNGQLLYSIYNTKKRIDKLFQEKFTTCEFILSKDEFLNTQDLKWKKIVGNKDYILGDENKFQDCIKLWSNDGSIYFTLNCLENEDHIVFKYLQKKLQLKVGDKIQFLLENNDIIEFDILKNIYSNFNDEGSKVYESIIPITSKELDLLSNYNISKWKIQFIDGSKKIIAHIDNNNQAALLFSIKYFVTEYINTVNNQIDNHKPLVEKKKSAKSVNTNQKCFVYLMLDTANKYHKIGISNQPKYREKTLQSEKPTIEILAKKEFPNRKIAHSFEKALHSTYEKKRKRGEWFNLSGDDVNDIISSLS